MLAESAVMQPSGAAEPLRAPRAPAAPQPRDLRIDLLRAVCVLTMLFGHLSWHELEVHTRFGYVTIAECFILISGATLGVVAKRRLERRPARLLYRHLLWRGLWLYGANLVAVAGAHLLEGSRSFPGNYFERYWGATPQIERWLSLDQPSVLNVLTRYAVFLLVAPLVIELLRRGRLAWVAAASIGLWGANFLSRGALRLPLLETVRAPYPVASWQLLFFGGIAAGWVLHRGLRSGALAPRRRGLLLVSALGLAAAAVAHHTVASAPGWLAWTTDRALLGPLRLVNVVALAIVAWELASWATPAVVRRFGRWLLPFGQLALPAFLLHIPLVWALLAIPAIDPHPELRKLAALVSIAVIWPLLRVPFVQRWLRP